MEYIKLISTSEAKYFIDENDKTIKVGGGAQASYNLPSGFLEYAKSKNILIEDSNIEYARRKNDGNAFVLHSDYTFKLGHGVLWLIGEEYNNIENKFIASINASNGKFQLYKKVYDKLDSPEYKWFVDLYNKNLSGNKLVLDIDEDNKILTLDIRFNAIKQNIDIDELDYNIDSNVYQEDE